MAKWHPSGENDSNCVGCAVVICQMHSQTPTSPPSVVFNPPGVELSRSPRSNVTGPPKEENNTVYEQHSNYSTQTIDNFDPFYRDMLQDRLVTVTFFMVMRDLR